MKIKEKAPEFVNATKVYEWNESTQYREQVFPDEFEEIGKKYCNWLLFYCWCYVRTQGFTNKAMKNWDVGNYGGKYKNLRDGIADALSEFIKFNDTEEIQEQKAIEKIYQEIVFFCQGIIYNKPNPLPETETKPPIPPIPPIPKPVPAPIPAPQKKVSKSLILSILVILSTIGGFIFPAWLQQLLDAIIAIIRGVSNFF